MCLVLLLPPALEHGWFADVTFDNLGSTLHSCSSAVWQISKALLADLHQWLQEAIARRRREQEAERRRREQEGERRGRQEARRSGRQEGERRGRQEAGKRVMKSPRDRR